MADGGFDPCECVFNKERAMQRLLSMISTGQSQCTDSQCLPDGSSGPLNQIGDSGSPMMWMMLLWMVVAVLLFLMRPKSLRGGKGSDDWNGGDPDHAGGRHGNNHPPPPEIH
eukprot:scpid79809/ scgid7602/ Uncharacterized protein C4orf34 homolog